VSEARPVWTREKRLKTAALNELAAVGRDLGGAVAEPALGSPRATRA